MHVDVRSRDGVVILKPIGDIIGPASDELRTMVEDQLETASRDLNILFDFAECSRIDSVGVGVLAGLHVSLASKGRRIGVINVGESINNVFMMMRLITMFEQFHTESHAIVNLCGCEGSE